MFIVLIATILNAFTHTKCVSLSNQKYKIQPTLFNLHLHECNQELHYYPFRVKLNNCVGSFNTLNNLSNRVSNRTEDLNIHVFNMITGNNKSKILTKDISCECKCRFDGKNVIQINDVITINVNVIVKNIIYVNKIIFGILLHVVAKIENI